MKRRGGGSYYQRGETWWVKYYRNGQPVRESSHSTSEMDAKALLNRRMGALAAGEPIVPNAERVTVDTLLDDLLTEYRVNGRRSLSRAEKSVKRLREHFGLARAVNVDTAAVRRYIDVRQAASAANATINRELAALKRAFTLAVQGRKLVTRPYIPMLTEDNVREGFFEADQFEAVCRHLPKAIQPVARFAYITGWRRGEILAHTWAQVDFAAGLVRLEGSQTKTRKARQFPLTPELRALLEAQRAATTEIASKFGRIIPWVFHRRGKPIKDFKVSWRTACNAAGVPGRLVHDFRRTAVRNLVRAGVPERVAMAMTGHKTRSVFDRYNIVSEADLHAAAAKLHEASQRDHDRAMGTNTGTVRRLGGR